MCLHFILNSFTVIFMCRLWLSVSLKKTAEAVSMMTCAREVLGSNLERQPICSEGFRRFAQFFPTSADIMP